MSLLYSLLTLTGAIILSMPVGIAIVIISEFVTRPR